MQMYKKYFISLLSIITITFASFSQSKQDKGSITVKTTLDSAYIEMGRITSLHVEVSGDLSETGGIILPDTLWKDIEIANPGNPILSDLGNGRKELKQEIILQAFDSGMYTLPPVLYLQDDKLFESNRPALKVIPADIDSLITINDYYDAQNQEKYFFDFLPDWFTNYGIWIIIGLIIIGIILYIYLNWINKGRIPLLPTKKPIPPYELAMSRLETLRNERLCEKGEEKEYYTRLVDILRNYLDSRFGINAMEMTSTQILKTLKENEYTKLSASYIRKILETADFVKFAKVRPLPDDNTASFKSAVRFVEETRPDETTEEKDQISQTKLTNETDQ